MNKIIPIHIYDTDIMLHLGSQDTLKEYLSLNFGMEDVVSILDGMNITNNDLGKTVLLSNGSVILWMPSTPTTFKEKGTLAHEVYHATCEIMNKIGVPPSTDNEEAYAYLIGYITTKVEQAITCLPCAADAQQQ